jgi:hypothetical protein
MVETRRFQAMGQLDSTCTAPPGMPPGNTGASRLPADDAGVRPGVPPPPTEPPLFEPPLPLLVLKRST